jgi:hypothetical protein
MRGWSGFAALCLCPPLFASPSSRLPLSHSLPGLLQAGTPPRPDMGDVIKLYNQVFVPRVKAALLRVAQDMDKPGDAPASDPPGGLPARRQASQRSPLEGLCSPLGFTCLITWSRRWCCGWPCSLLLAASPPRQCPSFDAPPACLRSLSRAFSDPLPSCCCVQAALPLRRRPACPPLRRLLRSPRLPPCLRRPSPPRRWPAVSTSPPSRATG